MTTTEYRLARTGQAALTFAGRLLSEATRTHAYGKGKVDRSRTWTVRLYETGGGRVIAQIEYRPSWAGEQPADFALAFNALDDAAEWLHNFDSGRLVKGFPPGEHFADRQLRLAQDMKQAYLVTVGEVLAAAGAEERVD